MENITSESHPTEPETHKKNWLRIVWGVVLLISTLFLTYIGLATIAYFFIDEGLGDGIWMTIMILPPLIALWSVTIRTFSNKSTNANKIRDIRNEKPSSVLRTIELISLACFLSFISIFVAWGLVVLVNQVFVVNYSISNHAGGSLVCALIYYLIFRRPWTIWKKIPVILVVLISIYIILPNLNI